MRGTKGSNMKWEGSDKEFRGAICRSPDRKEATRRTPVTEFLEENLMPGRHFRNQGQSSNSGSWEEGELG